MLIGVATFIKNDIESIKAKSSYQLRGMAVLSQYQGKHYGQRLLSFAIEALQKKQIDLLWCNARERALNFYLKQGFEILGDPFDIPNIGKHYVMFKKI